MKADESDARDAQDARGLGALTHQSARNPLRRIDAGNRWWRLRVGRGEFKLRLWSFDLIVELGCVRRNADWGFDGLSIELPSILLSVIDPRRLDRWDGYGS